MGDAETNGLGLRRLIAYDDLFTGSEGRMLTGLPRRASQGSRGRRRARASGDVAA